MKPKQVLATIMTFLLLMAYLPLLQVSAFQPPVIQLVSINGQTSTTVYAQEGEISYTIIGQSYSSNGKANVTFSIKNMDTQEVSQVYSQWLANSPNSGTFTLQEGTYEATVTAVDEEGRTSQPYVVTIIVGGDTDVATVSIEPNPIQVQHDGDLKEEKPAEFLSVFDDLAQEHNVNFSHILQNALKEYLGFTDRDLKTSLSDEEKAGLYSFYDLLISPFEIRLYAANRDLATWLSLSGKNTPHTPTRNTPVPAHSAHTKASSICCRSHSVKFAGLPAVLFATNACMRIGSIAFSR